MKYYNDVGVTTDVDKQKERFLITFTGIANQAMNNYYSEVNTETVKEVKIPAQLKEEVE